MLSLSLSTPGRINYRNNRLTLGNTALPTDDQVFNQTSVAGIYNAYVESSNTPNAITLLDSDEYANLYITDATTGQVVDSVTNAPITVIAGTQVQTNQRDFNLLAVCRFVSHNMGLSTMQGGLTSEDAVALITDISNRIFYEGDEPTDHKALALLFILGQIRHYRNNSIEGTERWGNLKISEATRFFILRALNCAKKSDYISPEIRNTFIPMQISLIKGISSSEGFFTRMGNKLRWSHYCLAQEQLNRSAFGGQLQRLGAAELITFNPRSRVGRVLALNQNSQALMLGGLVQLMFGVSTGGITAITGLCTLGAHVLCSLLPNENA